MVVFLVWWRLFAMVGVGCDNGDGVCAGRDAQTLRQRWLWHREWRVFCGVVVFVAP